MEHRFPLPKTACCVRKTQSDYRNVHVIDFKKTGWRRKTHLYGGKDLVQDFAFSMDSVGNAQEEEEEGKGPSENDSLVTTDRDGEVLQQEDEEEAKIGPSENDSLVIADRGGEVLGEVEKKIKAASEKRDRQDVVLRSGGAARCCPY